MVFDASSKKRVLSRCNWASYEQCYEGMYTKILTFLQPTINTFGASLRQRYFLRQPITPIV